MLSAIVCMDNFGGIGKDGDLLYKIPEDMKRFKELTIGHPIIMGRKTWNSIGNKPLKGRDNIILSKTLNYAMEPITEDDGYITDVHINKEIVEEVKEFLAESLTEYFVIGGQSIYEMFFPYCQKVYATIVYPFSGGITKADTFFPIDSLITEFDCIEDNKVATEETEDYLTVHFKTYVKKSDTKQQDKSTNSHAYSDPIPCHDAVKNPSHYCGKKYEVIDLIEDYGLSYCLGNVAKYICRAGKKYPGDKKKELQDLNKAKWYLDRRIEEFHNGLEADMPNSRCDIDIDDFIKDQGLSYIRGEIVKYISTFDEYDININLNCASVLLDAEIHVMEETV